MAEDARLLQLELATACYTKGRKLWTNGSRDDALIMFRKALAIQESILGTYHKNTARTYYWVGFALKHRNEYDKALVAYRRALRIRTLLFGEDDITTEDVHRALDDVLKEKGHDEEMRTAYFDKVLQSVESFKQANILVEKGQYEKAIDEYQKCLSIENDAVGSFPLDIAEIHYKIARAQQKKGEYDISIRSFREALVLHESSLGGNHPETIACLEGIEASARSRGMEESEVENYCKVLYDSIQSIKSGDEHASKGEFDKALEHFTSSLEIEETAFGKYPLSAADIYKRIAAAYRSKGEYDRAILELRTALTIFIFDCGSDHPLVLSALKEIGHTMKKKGLVHSFVNKYLNTVSYSVKYERYGDHICKEGDYEGAIEEYQKSMALEVSALGEYHLTQGALFKSIGTAFAHQGKFDLAIANYRNALIVYIPTVGKSHPETMSTTRRIGYAAEDKGLDDAQVERYKEVVSESVELELRGDTSLKKDEQAAALKLYKQAVALLESTLDQFQPCMAELYGKIAQIQEDFDKPTLAMVSRRTVFAIYQSSLDPGHPNIDSSRSELQRVAKLAGLGKQEAYEYTLTASKAIVLESKGGDLVDAKLYGKAISQYEAAIEVEESALGKSHLTTASIRRKIADVYTHKGSHAQAILLYRDTIKIWVTNGAAEDDIEETILSQLNLAVQGAGFSQTRGTKYQNIVLELLKREMKGDEHVKDGKHTKAILEYQRAIALEEGALGKLYSTTSQLYEKVADLCRTIEDFESAALFYGKTLAIYESYLGKDHPDTLRSYNHLYNMIQRDAASRGAGLEGWTTLRYVITGLIGLLVLIATVTKSLSEKQMPIKRLRVVKYEDNEEEEEMPNKVKIDANESKEGNADKSGEGAAATAAAKVSRTRSMDVEDQKVESRSRQLEPPGISAESDPHVMMYHRMIEKQNETMPQNEQITFKPYQSIFSELQAEAMGIQPFSTGTSSNAKSTTSGGQNNEPTLTSFASLFSTDSESTTTNGFGLGEIGGLLGGNKNIGNEDDDDDDDDAASTESEGHQALKDLLSSDPEGAGVKFTTDDGDGDDDVGSTKDNIEDEQPSDEVDSHGENLETGSATTGNAVGQDGDNLDDELELSSKETEYSDEEDSESEDETDDFKQGQGPSILADLVEEEEEEVEAEKDGDDDEEEEDDDEYEVEIGEKDIDPRALGDSNDIIRVASDSDEEIEIASEDDDDDYLGNFTNDNEQQKEEEEEKPAWKNGGFFMGGKTNADEGQASAEWPIIKKYEAPALATDAASSTSTTAPGNPGLITPETYALKQAYMQKLNTNKTRAWYPQAMKLAMKPHEQRSVQLNREQSGHLVDNTAGTEKITSEQSATTYPRNVTSTVDHIPTITNNSTNTDGSLSPGTLSKRVNGRSQQPLVRSSSSSSESTSKRYSSPLARRKLMLNDSGLSVGTVAAVDTEMTFAQKLKALQKRASVTGAPKMNLK